MSSLWTYFWPPLAAGLLIGAIVGIFSFRRTEGRELRIAAGAVAAITFAALWHGPLGAADRFSSRVERQAHEALQYYEMPRVTALLHRGPLTRNLILRGPADDFQHSELARLFSQVPGVQKATWSEQDAGLPLVAEGGIASLLGLLLGLLLAYLLELRRRYNLQWNW